MSRGRPWKGLDPRCRRYESSDRRDLSAIRRHAPRFLRRRRGKDTCSRSHDGGGPCWTAGSLSAGSFNRDSDLPCAEYLRCMSHQHCPFCARSCAHAGCSCQNEGAPHAHMFPGGDVRARTRGVLVRRVAEWGATWAETFSRCRPNPRHRHHLLPTMELQVFLVRCSTGRQRLRN